MTETTTLVDQAALVATWTPKRWERAESITLAARRLAADRGFDEFSLDDLAAAAEVSRRTLFNYFPGKLDAVLGLPPPTVHEMIEAFVAGGPTGDLLEDVADVIRRILDDKGMNAGDWMCLGAALDRSPKLLAAAHRRFRVIGEEITALIAEREGISAADPRASAALALISATLDIAITTFTKHPEDATPRSAFDAQLAALLDIVAVHFAWAANAQGARPTV